MLITLQTFLDIHRIEFILLQWEQNLSIHWDRILPDHYTFKMHCFVLLTPLMRPYILNWVSLSRVSVEYFFHHIFALRRHEFRNWVIRPQNLLIKLWGIRIFKWQVSTDKCEENNSTAPYISHQTFILLPSYHLQYHFQDLLQERHSRATRMLFLTFNVLYTYCWVQNRRSWSAYLNPAISSLVSDLDALFSICGCIKPQRPDVERIYSLLVPWHACSSLCSQRVNLHSRTPLSDTTTYGSLLFRRAGWCRGGVLVSKCGFSESLVPRPPHPWFGPFIRSSPPPMCSDQSPTFSPVRMWVPSLTFPNVPSPRVRPMMRRSTT